MTKILDLDPEVLFGNLFEVVRTSLPSCGYDLLSEQLHDESEDNDFFVPKMSYLVGRIIGISCKEELVIGLANYCGENLFIRPNGQCQLHCTLDTDCMVLTLKLFPIDTENNYLEEVQAIFWGHLFTGKSKMFLNMKESHKAYNIQEAENDFYQEIKKHS